MKQNNSSDKALTYIGFGSSIADRIAYIEKAIALLHQHENISILHVSPLYETIPYGGKAEMFFINGVLKIETTMNIPELFEYCKKAETMVGRKKRTTWDDREIDLDILLYNSVTYNDGIVRIPHKEIGKRDFVLQPLIDLECGLKHPETQMPLTELLDSVPKIFIKRKMEKRFIIKEDGICYE